MEKLTAKKAQPKFQHEVKSKSDRAIFMAAFLDMSWRMIVVVLVPIIGGFKLDGLLNTTPALTIIGFIVAMLGLYAVLKQTVATADDRFRPKSPQSKPDSREPRR